MTAVRGKKLIVFTPSVEWNYLYQRAHQMATCFGGRDDCTVLFLSTQRHYDNMLCCKQIKPGVFVANERMAGRIDEIAKAADCVVTSVYNITSMGPMERYHSDKVIYEYVDDLRFIVSKAVDFAPFEEKHRKLLQQADLSVATATVLFNEIEPLAKRALLLPNAVDYDFFSVPAEEMPELAEKRKNYRCVLEYYGALAPWFDFEVVKKSALAHPDWLWILIGKVIGDDMEKSGVRNLPNVCWIPPVPYTTLPRYIASADILTIPFVINETTLATSPVKLFEYMAAARPIVTSDMPECRKYGSVTRYLRAEEFDAAVEQALRLKEDPAYQRLECTEAQENTWVARSRAELTAIGLEV